MNSDLPDLQCSQSRQRWRYSQGVPRGELVAIPRPLDRSQGKDLGPVDPDLKSVQRGAPRETGQPCVWEESSPHSDAPIAVLIAR